MSVAKLMNIEEEEIMPAASQSLYAISNRLAFSIHALRLSFMVASNGSLIHIQL